MPIAQYGHHQVHYQLVGEADRPVITFLNGLTQNANLWTAYADHFVPRGYRVLAYDMLGQGRSSKPVIDIKLATHADMLASLLDQLGIDRIHLASISFGGIVGLDFAIRHGSRLHSLVAMSTFAELTPQLELLGAVMLQGLIEVGLPYLQSMLYPMNMSSQWIAANRDRIPARLWERPMEPARDAALSPFPGGACGRPTTLGTGVDTHSGSRGRSRAATDATGKDGIHDGAYGVGGRRRRVLGPEPGS